MLTIRERERERAVLVHENIMAVISFYERILLMSALTFGESKSKRSVISFSNRLSRSCERDVIVDGSIQ